MAKQRRTLKQSKSKKKTWYSIIAPKFLGEKELGESHLSDPSKAVGRTLLVNLMTLTGDIKNQTAEVKFRITSASDNKLKTKIIGYHYSQSAIKRLVRRRMTRIDDSFVIATKDNKKLRIKPLLLTLNRVSRTVEYNLRRTLREETRNIAKKKTYEELFDSVIKYKFQREIRDRLSKIYPVKAFEIRIFKEEKQTGMKAKPQKNTKEEKKEVQVVEAKT